MNFSNPCKFSTFFHFFILSFFHFFILSFFHFFIFSVYLCSRNIARQLKKGFSLPATLVWWKLFRL